MDNQLIGPAGVMSGYVISNQINGFSIPGMNNNLMPQHPTIKVDEGVKTEIPENEQHSQPVPTLDIKVSNVVCKFRVRCHINLRKLAQEAFNTEYDAAHSKVTLRLRKPHCIANIWSSGKIAIFGAKSEALCKQGARRVARLLQKRLNFEVKGLCCFEIVNIMASCKLPFGIKLPAFAAAHRTKDCSYEPELHAAANYRHIDPESKKSLFNLKVFSSGAITGTAMNSEWIQKGIQELYPKLEPFQRAPTGETSEEDDDDFKEEYNSDGEIKKTKKRKATTKKTKGRKKKAKIESDSDDDEEVHHEQRTIPQFDSLNQQYAQHRLGYRMMQNNANCFLPPPTLAPKPVQIQTSSEINEIDYMPPTPAPATQNL